MFGEMTRDGVGGWRRWKPWVGGSWGEVVLYLDMLGMGNGIRRGSGEAIDVLIVALLRASRAFGFGSCVPRSCDDVTGNPGVNCMLC